MSLVKTLSKVAMGMIAAKAMSKMMGGGNRNSGSGGLLGDLLGGSQQQQGGGLGDILGQLGGMQGSGRSGGGLGSILGQLSGAQQQGGGGLADLGKMLGGAAQGGGLGGLLGSLAGGQQGGSGGLGDLLNSALQGNVDLTPTPDEEEQAEIMLRAMITAAKADGEIDAEEQAQIVEHIGDDITRDELNLIRQIMAEPLDLERFADSVPSSMAQQTYMMSLLAIDLDSRAEAKYLNQLGQRLGISPQQANSIHQQLGEPVLYS